MARLVASSVVRGAEQGASHGGLYVVDTETGVVTQVVDWTTPDIDFSGRGGDRGLRGVACVDGRIFAASNDTILEFSQDFNVLRKHRSPSLAHAHEMAWTDGRLFVASTGFDAVIGLDIDAGVFDTGYILARDTQGPVVRRFDPTTDRPPRSNRYHVNAVTAHPAGGLTVAGAKLEAVLHIGAHGVRVAAKVPLGTHNTQVLPDGAVLYNDTGDNRTILVRPDGTVLSHGLPRIADETLVNAHLADGVLARSGFARGLCVLSDGRLARGSSPSRVSVFSWETPTQETVVALSDDVRNAIHGLVEWPA